MVVLFLADVILWSDRTNFAVAAAVWRRQLHWSAVAMGALLSAFSFGYLLPQPLGGYLSDRLGVRRTVSATCGGWSLFALLTPLAPAALWLTGTFRALLGVCEAPFFPATAVAVARAVPERARRGRYTGLINAGASLGPAVGTAGGALIARSLGTTWIFVLFGGAGLLVAAGWWLYAARRGEPAPGPSAWAPEGVARASEPELPLGRLLSSGTVWALLLSYVSLPYCLFLFSAWLPEYLIRYRHFRLIQAGFLASLPYLAAGASAVVAGLWSDDLARRGWTRDGLHRKLPVFVGAATYVVAILVAALTPSAAAAATMVVVAAVGLGFITGQYWTIVTDITPRQAGLVSGCMNFCGGVGATVAPLATGLLVASTGAFVLPFQVAAACMVAGTLVLALFVRVRPLSQVS